MINVFDGKKGSGEIFGTISCYKVYIGNLFNYSIDCNINHTQRVLDEIALAIRNLDLNESITIKVKYIGEKHR